MGVGWVPVPAGRGVDTDLGGGSRLGLSSREFSGHPRITLALRPGGVEEKLQKSLQGEGHQGPQHRGTRVLFKERATGPPREARRLAVGHTGAGWGGWKPSLACSPGPGCPGYPGGGCHAGGGSHLETHGISLEMSSAASQGPPQWTGGPSWGILDPPGRAWGASAMTTPAGPGGCGRMALLGNPSRRHTAWSLPEKQTNCLLTSKAGGWIPRLGAFWVRMPQGSGVH